MNAVLNLVLTSIIYALPLLSFIFLTLAIKNININFSLTALWCSLIAVVVNYQLAGDEILGSFFNFYNASLYSINLILFIASIIYTLYLLKSHIQSKILSRLASLIAAVLVTAIAILFINLWLNAFFVEKRFTNTPIMQVATQEKFSFCDYDYVFFKITPDAKVAYLCPNGHGLIASTGIVSPLPKFLLSQIPQSTKEKLKAQNKNWE
jgi:hypothetical protein